MHLTFTLNLNPFHWRKLAKYYASLYAKQAHLMIQTRGDYAKLAQQNAELTSANANLTQQNAELKRLLKQQNDRLAVIEKLYPNPKPPYIFWGFQGRQK